jgi:acyl-CoA thioester hydrolase
MGWLVTYTRKVRYSDTDAQAIVFNGNYATYFDDALTDLFDELDLGQAAMQDAGFEVVTANLNIDFRSSGRLGDVLETRVRLGRIGTKSLTFELETRKADTDELIVEGTVVWVTVDHTTFASIPVPALLLERLDVLTAS